MWDKIVTWLTGAGVDLLLTILLFVVGIIVVNWLTKLVRKLLGKTQLDNSIIAFLSNVVRIALVALLVVTALTRLGIPSSSLITALASAGVAIGLALQGSLANIAGGILLLVTKPFASGDFVEVDGRGMTVERIDMVSTHFHTPDNNEVIIPNGQLTGKTIINYTKDDTRRADFPIAISYKSDVETAKAALIRAGKSNPYVLADPEPVASVTGYHESAIELTLRVWCKSPDFASLSFTISQAMKEEFDKAGVEIPYNKLDVFIKQ